MLAQQLTEKISLLIYFITADSICLCMRLKNYSRFGYVLKLRRSFLILWGLIHGALPPPLTSTGVTDILE